MSYSVSVSVPATTANLGPGFDCIGAALSLYNDFQFTRNSQQELTISVTGEEAARVNTDKSNLLYQAFVKLYEHLEQVPPHVNIEINLGVPLARGLGSSATAIVGGLVGANLMAGEPLSQREVMELAITLEGHPDNVVPALLGGCRLAAMGVEKEPQSRRESRELESFWEICEVVWNMDVVPVVAIPNFELSTQEARKVLPTQVSRQDAIFNMSHLGLLLRGLETGRGDWLRAALQDRLHQPFRKSLIKGYDAVNAAAVAAGAYGMVISGAGPTLLALVDTAHCNAVAQAMETAWMEEGVQAVVRVSSIDSHGAKTFVSS
jgi:homoserine kinase